MSSRKRILMGIGELRDKLENLLLKQEAQRQDRLEGVRYMEEIISEFHNNKVEVTNFLFEERKEREMMCKHFDQKVAELHQILGEIDVGYNSSKNKRPIALTTGPVIRSELVENLYVEVLNNSPRPQNVRLTVYDLEQYPKQHIEHRIVTVLSKYAISEQFEIGPQGLDLRRFEVQVESLDENAEGIFVYIAGTQGSKYKLIQSNVIRHEQLVQMGDN